MPVNDVLTPMQASYIATNAYFTLKDWINATPTRGQESTANVHNRVLGPGTVGKPDPKNPNPTLQGTGLGQADLSKVFSGQTGLSTTSGFGYLLNLQQGQRRQVVIATRGTRPELGAPDLLTDLRGSMTAFGGYGPVHKGFKTTYDSILGSLAGGGAQSPMEADVIHCVGHSLGGAVATLVAAHFAAQGKQVKLYTFGSPRVGAGGTFAAMHKRIGKENIYRVAHDLDPISLIAPFPYIHVNPSPSDDNNMTLPSPTGELFSTANHDMNRYIRSVGQEDMDWDSARGLAARCDHDNTVLAKWLLHKDNDPGWVQYASARTLGLLFKLFSHALRNVSTSLILSLTAVDLLAEMILSGLYRAAALADEVWTLLRHAATWAGIQMAKGADFTVTILRRVLEVMLAKLRAVAALSLATLSHHLKPLPLLIPRQWTIKGGKGL